MSKFMCMMFDRYEAKNSNIKFVEARSAKEAMEIFLDDDAWFENWCYDSNKKVNLKGPRIFLDGAEESLVIVKVE